MDELSIFEIAVIEDTFNITVDSTIGIDGDDGREVEIRNSGTYIQWRYVGDVAWTNITSIAAITGGIGAKGLQNRGAYNALTAYVVDDVVTHDGSAYICTAASTGNLPTNINFWNLLVAKGEQGEAGTGGGGVTDHTLLTNIGTTTHANIDLHIANTSNPHSVTKTQVGLGNVDNTSDVNKPVSSATQTALDGKVDENAAITGATKTKITYDAKGLVTSGADATTADIADSTNRRYVTDAQLTVVGNTSGTNTGDQDLSGYATTTYVNGKIADSITDGVTTVAPSQNAVFDALALKAAIADVNVANSAYVKTALNAAGSAPIYAARTWVQLATGTGSPVISASGNISSVDDLGTGYWRLNFTVAMPDTNYAVIPSGKYYDLITSNYGFQYSWHNKTVNSVEISAIFINSTFFDGVEITVAIFR